MNPKREELIELLGGQKCKICEKSDVRVLEIDHIFGNGREMPLSKSDIIDMYLDNPHMAVSELQVLCRNCHKIKSLENGDLGRRRKGAIPITVKKEDIPRNILDNIDWYK